MIEPVTEAYRWGHRDESGNPVIAGETLNTLTNDEILQLMERFDVVQVWWFDEWTDL